MGFLVFIVIVSFTAVTYFHIHSVSNAQPSLTHAQSTTTFTPIVAVATTGSIGGTSVAITPIPVSTATVGTPIAISAHVTGPAENVTLVYARSGENGTEVLMNSVANGEYSYVITADQITGNLSYSIKAYDPAGMEFTTTVYHIAVADFALQPQTNALTVYRTKSVTFQLQLLSINNFTEPVQLSITGKPSGLTVSFAANPATAGMAVNLEVAANATVPTGTYPLTIIATYAPARSLQVTRQSVVDVTVTDFHASVAPSSQVAYPHSTTVLTVTLTLQNGFVNPVNITSISGLPNGATYTMTASNPTILTGVSGTTDIVLQIKIPSATKTGVYTILIVISGGGVTHSLTAQITIM